MNAEKFGILIGKDDRGRYDIYVVGVNGDKIVGSLSDLEVRGVSFGTMDRTVERAFQILKMRLSKKLVEFLTKENQEP